MIFLAAWFFRNIFPEEPWIGRTFKAAIVLDLAIFIATLVLIAHLAEHHQA